MPHSRLAKRAFGPRGWRAMAGKSITLKALRAREGAQVPPRLGLHILAVFTLIQLLLLAALLFFYPSAAGAAPVSGEVAVSTRDGYVRLVFTLSEETDAEVRLNNGILIIAFKQPVDVKIGHIAEAASSYAARRAAIRTVRPFALHSPARSPSTRWLPAKSCSSTFCPRAGPVCRPVCRRR